MLSKFAAPRIVILKADRLPGELICRYVKSLWSNSDVQVFQRGFDAIESMRACAPDLFITGVYLDDMDRLQHLQPFIAGDLPILVVTARKDPRTFHLLKNLRYDGIFDPEAEGMDNLQLAVEEVIERQLYISSSLVPYVQRPKTFAVP